MVGFKNLKIGGIMQKYGLRKDRLKAIRVALLDLFYESKVGVSSLEDITFSVSSYGHTDEVFVHGFIHVGNDCQSFRSIEVLDDYLDKVIKDRKKNKILFQSFKGVM